MRVRSLGSASAIDVNLRSLRLEGIRTVNLSNQKFDFINEIGGFSLFKKTAYEQVISRSRSMLIREDCFHGPSNIKKSHGHIPSAFETGEGMWCSAVDDSSPVK